MENVSSDLLVVFWLAFGAVGIGLLIAGATKKVVVYYDGTDMAVSAFGVILPFVALLMFSSTSFESTAFNWIIHWLLAPIIGIVGLVCVGCSFRSACHHNRSATLGLFVGVFKVIFVALTVMVIIAQIGKMIDAKSSVKDKVLAVIFLAIIGAVAKAMINGPEVYQAKGWVGSASNPQVF